LAKKEVIVEATKKRPRKTTASESPDISEAIETPKASEPAPQVTAPAPIVAENIAEAKPQQPNPTPAPRAIPQAPQQPHQPQQSQQSRATAPGISKIWRQRRWRPRPSKS